MYNAEKVEGKKEKTTSSKMSGHDYSNDGWATGRLPGQHCEKLSMWWVKN